MWFELASDMEEEVDVLGIQPTDQSCDHEVWIHLSHANARPVDQYRTIGNPYDHM